MFNFLLKNKVERPAVSDLPNAKAFAANDNTFITVPLYGELLVNEVNARRLADNLKSRVVSSLNEIADQIKTNHKIDVPTSSIITPLYESLANYSNLVIKTGDPTPFVPNLKPIQTILKLVEQYPDYDPDTLICDGDWTLRMTAYAINDDLVAIGVQGESVEERVASILSSRYFITNPVTHYINAREYVKDLELFSTLEDFQEITAPDADLMMLVYTRNCSIVRPVLLRSTSNDLAEKIKGELPNVESLVAENTENTDDSRDTRKPSKGVSAKKP